MGAQITFNFQQWSALFPEFSSTVNEVQAGLYFAVVGSLHRNDGNGPVNDPATQTNMMYLALAHLCFLYLGTNAQPATQLVGRITSAAEGSVNVQTDYGQNVDQSQAFWIQTKYGALYWQMSNPYRRMRYYPGSGFPGVPVGTPWPSPWPTPWN